MQTPIVSVGRFETENAHKYLKQLCKHFAHKVEARHDDTTGEVALPMGPCRMTAEPGALVVEVTAPDPEGQKRAQGVIDSHLARFAFREDFKAMTWS